MTKNNFINNIHLIISIFIVIPAAFIYGFNPKIIVNITPETIDELNFNKSIMGLYLSFSIVWLLGIFKPNYWKIAAITNIIFMLGLGFGRLFSFFIDGLPSTPYLLGTFGELLLGFYGIWILNTHYHRTTNT